MFCITSGPNHKFDYVNHAHIKALGFDATGMEVRVAQPESVEVHGILDGVYKTGVTASLQEIAVTVGPSVRYFDLTYAAKRDHYGNINGIMILGNDVTEQVIGRDKISKMLSFRDQFLSIASHELKTPLTSLNLQIQSSQRRLAKGIFDEVTPENISMLFHKYKKQTDRLIRLVDDMLDLSKINLGKLSFDFKRAELISLIENSYDHIKEHFQNKNTELQIVKDPHAIFGMFDQQRIEQVVINILMNALKYGEGKPVSIQILRKDDFAEIRFVDKGPGIPTEDLEKIFLKFERVPATSEVSGLGLGLYITKEIVEAHHGKIWVESQLGFGATFIILLPIESN